MAIGADLTKRDGILVGVAVAFVALVALYWFFPYANRQTALTELEARVERMTTMNTRAKADLASGGVAELQAEAEQYAEMFDVLRQLVPASHEVPTLLEQISTASRREGLELGGITPLPVIEGPEFDTHQYAVGIVGGYHAVARFLTNVGSLTRVVTPVDVKLFDREAQGGSPVRRRGDTALVQADFVIRTYVARTTPMAAPAIPGGN